MTRPTVPLAGLAALILVLPFEPTEPVGRWLGLELSSLELVAAACLGLGLGATWLSGRLPERLPLGLPAALFLVVCFLSTLIAAEPRLLPLKASLRVLAGIIAFLLASATLQREPRYRIVFGAFALAGLGVGALALVERLLWPAPLALLDAFREQSFEVGGEPRVTGSFAYPNLLGGFLAATLPMTLYFRDARPRLTAIVATLLFLTVLLTHSRGALLGALAASALVWLACRADRYLLRLHLGFAAVVGVVLFADPAFRSRATSESDRGWYEARIEPGRDTLALDPGELHRTPVTIANAGNLTWAAEANKPIHLSYRWFEQTGSGKNNVSPVAIEGERTRLEAPLAPNETRTVAALVRAPKRKGHYLLVWDMVHEHTTWFSDKVGLAAPVSVTVGEPEPRGPATGAGPTDWSSLTEAWHPGRLELWSAALKLFASSPVLGVGPDNFRWLYGPVTGHAAWDRRTYANSLYLETLATLGLAGIAALGWVLFGALHGLGTGPRDRVSVALFASTAGMLVHGLFDYLLEATPMYLTFWIVLGAVSAKIARETSA